MGEANYANLRAWQIAIQDLAAQPELWGSKVTDERYAIIAHKQAKIEQLSKEFQDQDIIILCWHYEGVDHRVFEMFIFEQYSIGDFVVSSGELAAMVFIDAVVRLIPGVVWNNKSLHEESFSEALEGKPEYPQYTRPADFMGYKVPEVLLSGDPKKINEWRKKN